MDSRAIPVVSAEKKALKGHDTMTISEKPAEAIPGPATILLLAIAALALAGWKWRQQIALSRRTDPSS